MTTNIKRILIVDDEKPLAHALELKLKNEGYETAVAYDGEECLKLIEANEYDLVLLDIMMPKLDGRQVLERIKGTAKNPKVFILSNLSQPGDSAKFYKSGADKYFIKSDTSLSSIVDEIKKI